MVTVYCIIVIEWRKESVFKIKGQKEFSMYWWCIENLQRVNEEN